MSSSKRAEKFAKPKVVCAFLPVDAPIKKTQEINFEETLKPMIRKGCEDDVKELFGALTSARQMVLWALDRDRTLVSSEELQSRLVEYGRLLRGFIAPPGGQPEEAPKDDPPAEDEKEPPKEKKEEAKRAKTLRHVVAFVWRDLLDVKGRDWKASDVALEEASMLLAAAQTVLSRAAREAVSDANAIQLHTNLRRVAGMLARARTLVDDADRAAAALDPPDEDDREVPEEVEEDKKKKKGSWWSSKKKKDKKNNTMDAAARASTDLRLALPEAWAQLSLAEAQHATVRRACAQPHIEWSLIAALCVDQKERYGSNVDGHVKALTKAAPEAANVREWAGKRVALAFLQSHVAMKTLYFEALVLYCQGAAALELAVAETDENHCVTAIAHLALAAAKHKEAQAAAERFVTTARPITYVDSPVGPLAESYDLIRRALDRANQLNNAIFHRPPSAQVDPLPEPKTLISAMPYEDPGYSPLWTAKAWDAFDPEKLPDAEFGIASDSRECCTIS
ncbi:hypothetical protein CTAYLR_002519 [Chrysophaeum taylorii]|uniref:BRO1 domain-containing protein n=1 Tax=Chrysophaeum taylorii TaxID=2483200 RepID=A0AAD7XJD1_9STRA|nr:hypothetical protein CTAYLR_002519 [Chrysophaeum taylorii]